jgi:hypothetical protein
MSVLANQTNATPVNSFFLRDSANVNFLSSLTILNGTINTSQINLDSVQMDCAILNSTPTLLLNGVPVASVSSFTSSITTWASYPALAPITYNTGAGTGGAISMANVNALSNVSSLTGTLGSLTVSSINGSIFPMNAVSNRITALASSTASLTNGQIVSTDFSAQSNGIYYIQALLQTASVDSFTCGFVVVKVAGNTNGGGVHMPSFNPYGSQPTTANMIVCQSASVNDNVIDLLFFSNGTAPAGILGSTVQIAVFRLT